MDFQSHQTVPKPLLSYLLPYSQRSIALVKRLAGSPKGAEIDPNLPHANKVLPKVAHAFLYTWMDFFQSHQTVPKPLLSYLLPYSQRSIALKRLAGSPKGAEIDPNLPHANKSVTPSTRILIYMDGLLSIASNCAQAVAILPSSIPERSIALVKRLAGSPKGAEIDPNLR
jgi:hypothetical protein